MSKVIIINAFICLVISILLILSYNCGYLSTSLVNQISLVGTWASIHGIGLALWQLRQVKNVTTQVNEAVSNKLNSLNNLFTLSDITKYEGILRELHYYIDSKEYYAAAEHIDSVVKFLSEINRNSLFDLKSENLQVHISELNSDVRALHNLKRNQNATVDFDLISSHMINVSRILYLISSQIKNNNYGNKI